MEEKIVNSEWNDQEQATFDSYVCNIEAVIELIEEVSESDYIYPKEIVGEDGRTVDFNELRQDLITFLKYIKSALE